MVCKFAALISLSALAFAAPAAADDWPSRPMTMVVPFAAGGAVDVLGRTLAASASEILGQQIVIENIGGAGGMAGFDAGSWNVVFLPKGTPQPIVAKLNAAFSQALDAAATRQRLDNLGVEIPVKERRAPAYAAKFVQGEIKKYEGPIKAAGIVIE